MKSAALAAISIIHIEWATHRRYSLTMSNVTKTNYDVGVAGSITMIVLTVAVVILLRSFYKRFSNVKKDDQK